MIRKENLTDRTVQNVTDLDGLNFWENGLLPVVAQDANTGSVLMVAFANREALEKTITSRQMHYWSRSRQELWHKGATSGNFQDLVSLHTDCDSDTLLARVHQVGPACHTGEDTCFGDLSPPSDSTGEARAVPSPETSSEDTLPTLWALLRERALRRPEGSYTVKLLDDENLRLKKLGEETAELLLALARHDQERIPEEAADLLYHILVAMMASGTTLEDLLSELDRRRA